MARRVFFSFHYQRDIWRVNVVRNAWCLHRNREEAGYWDASLWERTKMQGDSALRQLINQGLYNTSVTVVLIGSENYSRKWVKYEIIESYRRGNALLGINIHDIPNREGIIDYPGPNPFDHVTTDVPGWGNLRISGLLDIPIYNWKVQDGFHNIGSWVEYAANLRGL